MTKTPAYRRFVRHALCAALPALAACSGDNSQPTESKSQAIYSIDQARVFGFESPSTDWTGDLLQSGDSTEGSFSGQLQSSGGFSTRTKVSLGDLGAVGTELTLDLNPPDVAGWSTVRIDIHGSNQIGYISLGTVSTANLTPGTFNTVRFPQLAVYQAQLNQPWPDLEVEVVVNGPAGIYQLDNLRFGGEADFDPADTGGSGGSGGTGGGGTGGNGSGTGGSESSAPSRMIIRTPYGASFSEVVLGAQDGVLDIHDRVKTYSGASLVNFSEVSSVGTEQTIVGRDTEIGELYSAPSVWARTHSHFQSDVRTSGLFGMQDASTVVVDGEVYEGASMTPLNETIIEYRFPEESESLGVLTNDIVVPIAPGAYGTTLVQGGATLRLLGPGTFYFDDLLTESGTRWEIDNSDGAVLVFVKGEFRARGRQVIEQQNKRNILIAVEGVGPVTIGAYFDGVLLAPEASLDIPTQYETEGAFFGKDVIAHQSTRFRHYPFVRDDCDTACGVMFGCPGQPNIKACPGEVGGGCNGGCVDGLTCGTNNGVHFGLSKSADVCWSPTCEAGDFFANCGEQNSLCGNCSSQPTPCISNYDCVGADVCGTQNGWRHGSDSPRVCEPADCSGALEPRCGSADSECGECVCAPTCDDKTCGDDPDDGCGGICLGLCEGDQLGCKSNFDCGPGEMCRATIDGTNTKCVAEKCALLDPSSALCKDGVDPCGRPCTCGPECQLARTSNYPDAEYSPLTVPGSVPGSLNVSTVGIASYSIPLTVPQGRGLTPSLSVQYSSSASDGILGPNWQVTGFSQIRRCPKVAALDDESDPVRYNEDDALCLDGSRLIEVDQIDSHQREWRTERETFRRIFSINTHTGNGIGSFVVEAKNGLKYFYGTDNTGLYARANPLKLPHIRVWALRRVEDRTGNWIEFDYNKYTDDTLRGDPRTALTPRKIRFSPGDRHVEFLYDERGKGTNSLPLTYRYTAGVRSSSLQRLRAIEMKVADEVVRRYRFTFEDLGENGSSPTPETVQRRLQSVHECGVKNGRESCFRPTSFEYQEETRQRVELPQDFSNLDQGWLQWGPPLVLDANADGMDDVYIWPHVYLATGNRASPFRRLNREIRATTRSSGKRACFEARGLVDLDHDGRVELVNTCGKSNSGFAAERFEYSPQVDDMVEVAPVVLDAISGYESFFADFNGDSFTDVLVFGGDAGIYEYDSFYKEYVRDDTRDILEESGDSRDYELLDVDGDGAVNLVRFNRRRIKATAVWEYWDYGEREWKDMGIRGRAVKERGPLHFGDSYNEFTFKLIDLNTDGLVDVLFANDERLIGWYSMGDGTFVQRNVGQVSTGQPSSQSWDVNDFAHSVAYPTPLGVALFLEGTNEETLGPITASGRFSGQEFKPFSQGFIRKGGWRGVTLIGDFNGDGGHDFFSIRPLEDPNAWHHTRSASVTFTNIGTAGSLSAVETGLGLRSEIDYGDFDSNHYVVDEECFAQDERGLVALCQTKRSTMVEEVRYFQRSNSGALKKLNSAAYEYRNIRQGLGGRGSYGPSERSIWQYDDQGALDTATTEEFINSDYVLAGLAKRVVQTSRFNIENGAITYSAKETTENHWSIRYSDEHRPFPVLEWEYQYSSLTPFTFPNPATPDSLLSQFSEHWYDSYGNETGSTTKIFEPGRPHTDAIEIRESTVEYAHDDDPAFLDEWLLELPTRITSKHTRGGVVERKISKEYDLQTGLLSKATREGDVDEKLTSALSYDEFGNVVAVIRTDSEGSVRESRRTYGALSLFPATFFNDEGHSESFWFDMAIGKPTYHTDANALATEWTYDEFGRLRTEIGWQGSSETTYTDPTTDAWDGNGMIDTTEWAKFRVSTHFAGGGVTQQDTDALGREVMSRSTGYEGEWVTQTRAFDWRGNVVEATRPHAGTSTEPGLIENDYDLWGRITKTSYPDGTHVDYGYRHKRTSDAGSDWFRDTFAQYSEWRSKRSSSASPPKESVVIRDYAGAVVTTVDARGTLTDFKYAPYGNLRQIVHEVGASDEGNITRIEYDRWGRVLELDDPSTGLVEYEYSGFDDLVTTRDARGVWSSYQHDALGRVTSKTDNWPGKAPEVSTWTYDEGAAGVGRLHSSSSSDGVGRNLEYYERGNAHEGLLKSETLVVGGEQFRTHLAYDSYKRPTVAAYPAVNGEVFEVVNNYDSNGFVMRVDAAPGGVIDPRAEPLWRYEGSHEAQLVNRVRLGGTVARELDFEQSTFRLTGLSASSNSGDEVQDLTFGYTDSGDLEWRETGFAGATNREVFDYDALHRLRNVTRFEGDSEGETTNFVYNARGNLTSKGGVTYGYDVAVGPHAVVTAGDNSYGYDQVGNQISRSGSWVEGGEQAIDYNVFNLPKRVSTGPAGASQITDFEYDADGERVIKRSDLFESLNFSDLYERVKEFDSELTETHKYFVFANGERIAQISRVKKGLVWEDSETVFLLSDNLGSVETIVDSEGTALHRQQFSAFGESLNPEFSEEGIRFGFTGHPHDADLGLVDMGGRMYDPVLARFLSADPLIQEPYDLRSHNRYSYAWNNPLGMTDPSGYQTAQVNPDPPAPDRTAVPYQVREGDGYRVPTKNGMVSLQPVIKGNEGQIQGADKSVTPGPTPVGTAHNIFLDNELLGTLVNQGDTFGNGANYGWFQAQAGADAGVGGAPTQGPAPASAPSGATPSAGPGASGARPGSGAGQGGAGPGAVGGGPGAGGPPGGGWVAGVKEIAGYASWLPGPIGMGASAVVVGINIFQGNYMEAATEAIRLIPGGKLAAKIAKSAKSAGIVKGIGGFGGDAVQAAGALSNKVTQKVKNAVSRGSRRPGAATRRAADDAARDAAGNVRCQYCGQTTQPHAGAPNSREFDHVDPWSKGGDSGSGNIVSSCRTCNRGKSDKDLVDWLDL